MKIRVLAALLLFASCSAHAEEVLTFGIVPQQSASKLARLWGPILKHISAESGVGLQFATAPDIPTFEKRLAAGEYDLAYMNPYHYTTFHESPGYRALAKARDKRIKGILVVRKNSNIENVEQLNNLALAFPAPAAFAASILTRSYLAGEGLTFTPKYVSSHDSVYRAVAKGLYPAGGGVIRTFKNVAPEIRDQLEVFWTSEGFTPHAIAVHPRINGDDVSKIQNALVAMESAENGKALLNSIKIKGFTSAVNEDWDDVRALHLTQLSDL